MRQETKQNVDEAETLCSIRNVLIFDEDIEDLARHAEPFEAHGFDVHKCMSVEAAMRSVEREDFDFALVDQASPAFEGRDKTFGSLQLIYAICRGGPPEGNGVASAGTRTRSNGLFRKARPQSGHGSDYQVLFRKLANEMS
jgi:hypothetical protein